MFGNIVRLALAAALLATMPVHPGASPSRAAGCGPVRDASALALVPGATLLAGTRSGALYRLRADCWSPLTPLPGHIEIGTLLAVPGQHPTLLAGGSWLISTRPRSWQLYRSTDGGAHWLTATAGLPKTAILPVQTVLTRAGTLIMSYVCPADQQYATVTPHCPQGLARSVDGGRSWRPVGPGMPEARGLVVLGDGSLLAATVATVPQDGLVYTSRDDGRTWRLAGRLVSHAAALWNLGGMTQLYAVPWEPRGVIGVGDLQSFSARLFHSTDGGAHWVVAPLHGVHARSTVLLAVTGLIHAHSLLVGAHSLGAGSEGIYRSSDGGATWIRTLMRPAAAPPWALLPGADGATAYAATPRGVYRSRDDGRTWQRVGG